MLREAQRPIVGFVAASGTGKTTLLEKLIPLLTERGLRVALVKHTHHEFDIDQPGKDSYRLREAGAAQVMVASRRRWALMTECGEGAAEPNLDELLRHLDQGQLDLILVEGFKHERFPKIELHRKATDRPFLFPEDADIIALATDAPVTAPGRQVLNLNEPSAIAEFIIRHFIPSQDRRKPAGRGNPHQEE